MRAYFEGLYKGGIDRLMSDLTESLEKGKKRFVITANPEIYMQAEKYPELRRLFTDGNTVVADGIGVVKACRRLGVEGVEKSRG